MIEEHRDSQNDTDIYKKEKKVKLLSRVRLFATPWTVAYHAPSSIGFPRQEYWSGLPFPSPGVLPDPGIESECPALQAGALLLGHVSALVIISLLSMSVTLFLFCKHLFVLF